MINGCVCPWLYRGQPERSNCSHVARRRLIALLLSSHYDLQTMTTRKSFCFWLRGPICTMGPPDNNISRYTMGTSTSAGEKSLENIMFWMELTPPALLQGAGPRQTPLHVPQDTQKDMRRHCDHAAHSTLGIVRSRNVGQLGPDTQGHRDPWLYTLTICESKLMVM